MIKKKAGMILFCITFGLLIGISTGGAALAANDTEVPIVIRLLYETGETGIVIGTMKFHAPTVCSVLPAESEYRTHIPMPEKGYAVEWRTKDGILLEVGMLLSESMDFYAQIVRKPLTATIHYGREHFTEQYLFEDAFLAPTEIDGRPVSACYLDQAWQTEVFFPLIMEEDIDIYIKFEGRPIVVMLDGEERLCGFGELLLAEERTCFQFEGFFMEEDGLCFDGIVTESVALLSHYRRVKFQITLMLKENAQENRYVTIENAYFTESLAAEDFLGWCIDEEKYHLFDTEEEITNDFVLYARYEQDMETVVYLGFDGEILKSQRRVKGEATEPPDAPNIDGYRFDGWEQEIYHPNGTVGMHAIYRKLELEVICYNIIQIDYDGIEVFLQTAAVGETVSLTAPIIPAKKFSYLLAMSGETALFVTDTEAGGLFVMPAGDVTVLFFYADQADDRNESVGDSPKPDFSNLEKEEIVAIAIGAILVVVALTVIVVRAVKKKKK